MIQWRRGVVVEVRSRWAGAVEYAVRLASDDVVRALGYVEVVGDLRPGTAVLLNTTALERGLGTGGLAIVVAAPDALPRPVDDVSGRAGPRRQGALHALPDHGPRRRRAGQRAPRRARRRRRPRRSSGRRRRPALGSPGDPRRPARAAPSLRVAYVMTDGGALPIDFSRTVAGLREAGWLEASDHGRAGLRRRPRGRQRPHRPARRAPRRRRRRRRRVAGPGQPRHGHAVGLLRHVGGRGRQRRGDPRRPARLLAADLGGRPARAAPRRLAPQPDGIRPRGARACRRARAPPPGRRRRPGARAGAPALRDASGGRLVAARGRHRRPRRGAARDAGAAAHHGPRIRRRPRRISRRGRRGAVCRRAGAFGARHTWTDERCKRCERVEEGRRDVRRAEPGERSEPESSDVVEVDDEDQRLAGLDGAPAPRSP